MSLLDQILEGLCDMSTAHKNTFRKMWECLTEEERIALVDFAQSHYSKGYDYARKVYTEECN